MIRTLLVVGVLGWLGYGAYQGIAPDTFEIGARIEAEGKALKLAAAKAREISDRTLDHAEQVPQLQPVASAIRQHPTMQKFEWATDQVAR